MEVFNSANNLMEELKCLRLFDALVLYDVVKELATVGVLHDQIQLLRRLNNLVELNDVGVPDHF